MKLNQLFSALAAVACGALVIAQQSGTMSVTTPKMNMTARADADMVKGIIANWIPEVRMTAETTIAKYGQPNSATETELVWWHNGPWKKTKLENVAIPHDFPGPHHDMLQQTIDWKINPSWVDDLGKYDGSVIVERTRGEVSARCDKEEANFLALNLTYDIVMKNRNVKQARAFYADTIMQMKAMRLDMAHKPYVSGFIFSPPMKDQNDPDMPAMKMGG